MVQAGIESMGAYSVKDNKLKRREDRRVEETKNGRGMEDEVVPASGQKIICGKGLHL
jgi:hypothetical protein